MTPADVNGFRGMFADSHYRFLFTSGADMRFSDYQATKSTIFY